MSAVLLWNSTGVMAIMVAALGLASPAARAEWSVTGATPGMTECVLETGEISLFDGYQDTRLRLSVTSDELRVKTDSNIDFSFDDVGLSVDGKAFIPADTVVDEKQVLFNSTTQATLEQFIRGQAVTVYLRFWPSYPATKRYQARFSLIGFTRAYNNYKACSNKASS